jgi:hypothetical protein
MAGKHYSVEEARERMASLSTEDWEKSLVFAKTVLKNARVRVSPRELLHEAVLRTLAGKRHWKSNLEAPAHFFGAMKSILNAWNKADVRRSNAMSRLRQSREDDDDLDLGYLDVELRAQLHKVADKMLNSPKLSAKLSETSRAVLMGIVAGQAPHEIMRDLKIDAKKFRKAVLALSNWISARMTEEEVS